MRLKTKQLAAAVAVVVVAFTLAAGWWLYRDLEAGLLRGKGDDPRIGVYHPGYLTWRLPQSPGSSYGADLRVVYREDTKCLYLEDSRPELHDDERLLLAVWPQGTKPVHSDGRRGVDVPHHGTIFEGDVLTDVTGIVTWTMWAELHDRKIEVVEQCLNATVFMFEVSRVLAVEPADET